MKRRSTTSWRIPTSPARSFGLSSGQRAHGEHSGAEWGERERLESSEVHSKGATRGSRGASAKRFPPVIFTALDEEHREGAA